jgi:excisionase family DNA binding protein
MDAADTVRILRPREAAAALGIGRSTLYQLIGRGELRLVRLGPRTVGVRSDDIARWIETRPVVAIRPPANGGA